MAKIKNSITTNNTLRNCSFALLVLTLILSACSKSEPSLKTVEDNNKNNGSQNVYTSVPVQPTLIPTMTPSPVATEDVNCKAIHKIIICIQDITRAEAETQVRLKIAVENSMVTGAGGSFIYPDDQNGIVPILLDEKGNSYSLIEDADNSWAEYDDKENAYFQTLHFQPASAEAQNLTVSLPIVAVDAPVTAEAFQIDLGQDPQPGQIRPLDVTADIDGQEFHFVKAEFGGDGIQSLLVTLHMEALKLPDDVFWMSPAFGDPEKGIFFGQKFGASQIFAELALPPGRSSGSNSNIISGVLNLKVERVTYWYSGPFEITYQLP